MITSSRFESRTKLSYATYRYPGRNNNRTRAEGHKKADLDYSKRYNLTLDEFTSSTSLFTKNGDENGEEEF